LSSFQEGKSSPQVSGAKYHAVFSKSKITSAIRAQTGILEFQACSHGPDNAFADLTTFQNISPEFLAIFAGQIKQHYLGVFLKIIA